MIGVRVNIRVLTEIVLSTWHPPRRSSSHSIHRCTGADLADFVLDRDSHLGCCLNCQKETRSVRANAHDVFLTFNAQMS